MKDETSSEEIDQSQDEKESGKDLIKEEQSEKRRKKIGLLLSLNLFLPITLALSIVSFYYAIDAFLVGSMAVIIGIIILPIGILLFAVSAVILIFIIKIARNKIDL